MSTLRYAYQLLFLHGVIFDRKANFFWIRHIKIKNPREALFELDLYPELFLLYLLNSRKIPRKSLKISRWIPRFDLEMLNLEIIKSQTEKHSVVSISSFKCRHFKISRLKINLEILKILNFDLEMVNLGIIKSQTKKHSVVSISNFKLRDFINLEIVWSRDFKYEIDKSRFIQFELVSLRVR